MADAHSGPSRRPQEALQREAVGDVSYFADTDATWMSCSDVDRALDHVIAAIVRAAGFDGIESMALAHVRTQLETAMDALLHHASELSAVAKRRTPSMRDLFIALVYAGPRMHPAELLAYLSSESRRELQTNSATKAWTSERAVLKEKRRHAPQWSQWCNDWLASDDEEEADASGNDASEEKRTKSGTVTWGQKRRRLPPSEMEEIPAHLPALPPRHTWKSSPAFTTQNTSSSDTRSFIEAKVSSTRLTEASLRSLIRATELAQFDGHLSRMRKAANRLEGGETIGLFNGKDGLTSSHVDTEMTSPGNKSKSATAQEAERSTRKGRGLSLRLRTTTTSSPSADDDGTNAAESSRSVDGPRSAHPRASLSFSLPSRRGSLQTGAISAGSPQASGWNNGASGQRSGNQSAAMTPLTPGAGFVYPDTPSDLYSRGFSAGRLGDGEEGSGQAEAAAADATSSISIPGVVNYKRTWYKKTLGAS